jgi:hypothetical protein
MFSSIFNQSKTVFNQSKTVYECLDEGKSYHCYGFYFELDRKILEQPVFCFIGDPEKLQTMYDFSSKSEIKINGKAYLLPLGFKIKGIWRQWDKEEIAIPTVIGEIALTAETLCLSALESFMVKIELETEVQNLHHKHSQAKIEQIQSTIQDIESQLELFATNLGDLFERIVKERNLLNSIQDFPINSPIELTQRNEDLKILLAQFHQLDLPNYGLGQDESLDLPNYRLERDYLSQIQVDSKSKYIERNSRLNLLSAKSKQPRLNIDLWKKSISMEIVMNLTYVIVISVTVSSIILIILGTN